MTVTPFPGHEPLDGILRYVEEEHSFRFDVASPVDLEVRSGAAGVTSLSIGTLQIEVGVETRLALFAWGLHPRHSWRPGALRVPRLRICGARIETPVPLQRGVSLAIADTGEWSTKFDEGTGWVLTAPDTESVSEQVLLIAKGVAVGITDGALDSLWLHPVFE